MVDEGRTKLFNQYHESTAEDQHLAIIWKPGNIRGDSAHARHETFGEKLDVEGLSPDYDIGKAPLPVELNDYRALLFRRAAPSGDASPWDYGQHVFSRMCASRRLRRRFLLCRGADRALSSRML